MVLCSVQISITFAQEDKKEQKIEIINIEPFDYAALEMTGSYEQHEAAFGNWWKYMFPSKQCRNDLSNRPLKKILPKIRHPTPTDRTKD